MLVVTFVRTIVSRLLLLCVMMLFFIPVAIYVLLPRAWLYESKYAFKMINLLYRAMLKCSLLPIKYEGLQHIPHGQEVIFAANHQSSIDIPLLGVLARGNPHVWLAWIDLMKSPILRFLLPRVAVLVDQSTPLKSMRSLLQIMNLTKEHHMDIMIFPEGGRYTDGKIHDFFGGFAILAKKTGRAVVPVYMHGINKAYPPNAFLVQRHAITVTVGKPFVFASDDTEVTFKQRVYQWFAEQAEDSER